MLRIKFCGGRQFCASKSPTSCSCKTLATITGMMILRFTILFFLWACIFNANACKLIFESEKIFIKVASNSIFRLIDKEYSAKRAGEIRKEILSRIIKYKSDEVRMDGMNLTIYLDNTGNSYQPACLRTYMIFDFIKDKKTKIISKVTKKEIINITTRKVGSRKSGLIERYYIDKETGEVILKKVLYRGHCILPTRLQE